MKQQVRPKAQRKWKMVLTCLAVVLLGGLVLWNLRIDTVYVKGDNFYTDQEIEDYLFGSKWERNYLYAYVTN